MNGALSPFLSVTGSEKQSNWEFAGIAQLWGYGDGDVAEQLVGVPSRMIDGDFLLQFPAFSTSPPHLESCCHQITLKNTEAACTAFG